MHTSESAQNQQSNQLSLSRKIAISLICLAFLSLLGYVLFSLFISGSTWRYNRQAESLGEIKVEITDYQGWTSVAQYWEIRERGIVFYVMENNNNYHELHTAQVPHSDLQTIITTTNSLTASKNYRCSDERSESFLPTAHAQVNINGYSPSCFDAGGVNVKFGSCTVGDNCFYWDEYADTVLAEFIDKINPMLEQYGFVTVGDHTYINDYTTPSIAGIFIIQWSFIILFSLGIALIIIGLLIKSRYRHKAKLSIIIGIVLPILAIAGYGIIILLIIT